MRATDLPGGAARRDDMGVSHAADGSAALAPAQRSRSERALVQSAQRGDPGAVEELYRRHWRQAYRAAYLVTRDAHAAEDIAQEAFLQAIRVLDRFDRARPFAPWLHRIVTNRALDWARAHALRRPAEAAHEAVAPEARSDLSDDLAEAIGRLAPDARAVVVLRYLLEHTPGEIAEMLDLPRGTVNSRLRRALDELAGEVELVNAREHALKARLQGFEAPGEVEAGERGRRLVLAAFAERTPVRRRRAGLPRIVWPVLAALLAAGAVAVAGYLHSGKLAAPGARAVRRAGAGRRGARARARGRLDRQRARPGTRPGPRQRWRPLAARAQCRARLGLRARRGERRRRSGALAGARNRPRLPPALVARAHRAALLPGGVSRGWGALRRRR